MNRKEPSWTIYCHIHRESGRRYIGLTKKTWRQRWNSHVYNAFNRPKEGRSYFWAAIRKYGKDAFDHEVLEVCFMLEKANEREQHWIDLYDTRNPIRGFNLAPGGKYRPNPIRKNPWDDPDYLWNDPGYRLEHGRKMKEIVNRPDVKVKLEAARAVFMRDPEWLAKVNRAGIPLSKEHREALAESTSRVKRKVPGHVSCGKHGLVPFSECFKAKSRTGRVLHRCKHCILNSSKAKLHRLITGGFCIACKKARADAGTRCRPCADKRLRGTVPG